MKMMSGAPADPLDVPAPPQEFMDKLKTEVVSIDVDEFAAKFADLAVPLGQWLAEQAVGTPAMAKVVSSRIVHNKPRIVQAIIKSPEQFLTNVILPLHMYLAKFKICEKVMLCPSCSAPLTAASSSGPGAPAKPQ
jgi:hypothetical protein